MNITRPGRGFEALEHPTYPQDNQDRRIITQSSAVGDYRTSMSKPGSSFLWFGVNHHLNRAEVRQVIRHLRAWLKTGSLEIEPTHEDD